jgi:hypothetical protein
MRLTRDEHDVLYRAVVLDLSGLDDVHKSLEQGNAADAQEERQHFENDWALLDAIGWDAENPRLDAEFDGRAMRAARSLEKQATGCLETANLRESYKAVDGSREDFEDVLRERRGWADENLDLLAVCRRILAAHN